MWQALNIIFHLARSSVCESSFICLRHLDASIPSLVSDDRFDVQFRLLREDAFAGFAQTIQLAKRDVDRDRENSELTRWDNRLTAVHKLLREGGGSYKSPPTAGQAV